MSTDGAPPIDSSTESLRLGCLAWDAGAAGADASDSSTPVEARLEQLAAAVGPLRRVIAALAERLVESRAYERLCYARLADYGREQPGVSARQLQELARVHRALAELPGLEQALVTNVLPWSKVRLVARVATAEDEDAWIARAREVPTRRLELEVRESSRRAASGDASDSGDQDDGLPERRVAVRCTPAVREKWSVVCELAERVAGQCLQAAEVLEFVIAEAFSTLSIDPAFAAWPDPQSDRPGGGGSGEPPLQGHGAAEAFSQDETESSPRAPTRSIPHAVLSLLKGLEDADAFELDHRLRRAVRLEQTLDAAIAPLLRVVGSAEHEWRGSYRTLPAYVRNELGMSARKARALLRLERAGDVCPELRAAYRSGRLSWVKAQYLLPLLLLDIDGEWRPAWVDWAARVTVRRLTEDVERALLLRAGHDRAWQRCKFHPERARDPIPSEERQLCAPDVDAEATQQLVWRVPHDVAVLFTAVRETLLTGLEGRPTDGQVFDTLLDGAISAWTRREPGTRRPDPVIERDGYLCAVPGCTSRRSLHNHHIEFRSAGGSDAPDNRITLCAFHHQRCVHAGLLTVRGCAPDGLVFELGLRAGSTPLARYGSGDVAIAPSKVASLPRAQRAA